MNFPPQVPGVRTDLTPRKYSHKRRSYRWHFFIQF